MMTANARPETGGAPKRLVLVDGSGFIFRAYHSLPPLTRADGTPVGAVYGFINMLTKLRSNTQAEYMAVIFDAARRNYRNDLYPEYKANRPPAPEDLVPQFPLVREATRAFNLPAVEMEGFEADDLIATYARQAVEAGMEVVIVSSDKDLMQLIRPGVRMTDPMKQKDIGPEQVLEKFGVAPEKVIEVQALIGDSVDNIPGVPGIGPKTAAELIGQYGDLETLLAHAHEIKQPKRREAILANAEKARLSRQLVLLKDDVPVRETLEDFITAPLDNEALMAFLQTQQFTSLMKKFGGAAPINKPSAMPQQAASASAAAPASKKSGNYTLVQSIEALKSWITRAAEQGRLAFDCETTSLQIMQAELVGFSLALSPGEACYVPLGHIENGAAQSELFGGSGARRLVKGQIPINEALALMKPLLENPAVLKIGQNIKYDMGVLARYGIQLAPVDDTMLISYALDAGLNRHNMDELSLLHLQHKPIAFSEVVGSGKQQKNFSEVTLEAACQYAAEDADITLQLHDHLKPRLIANHLVSVYEAIDRPLLPVISAMERAGIAVDAARLHELSREFGNKMASLEKEIHALAGSEFNIGSPKQLGEILFERLSIAGGKKSSKTDSYSTHAEVLEELAAQGHTIAAKVLDWRTVSKLKSTYADALVEQIDPVTGRVHTSFALAVASTGRLSSSDPNVQNIPIRTEEGRKIRGAFVAAPGHVLISADYSQIELRLLAHIAGIEVLKKAFQNGEDIHATTASQMFGMPISEVDSEHRRKAKTINFGIIYGISAHGLAARLGISRGEAAAYIEAYFKQYPGIKDYMEAMKALAHTQGYVSTLDGRRVHFKDINSKNPNLRAFSERAAINAPLQGTAADIMKKAMVSVFNQLAGQYPNARLLLQVHDELLVEAPEAIARPVADLMQQGMRRAAHLSIPLEVDTGMGESWGNIKG